MSATSESVKKDRLARTANRRKISSDALSLKVSNTAGTSYTFAPGEVVTATVTLRNDKGLRLFATPHITVYEGSVSSSNVIKGGASVNWDDWEFGQQTLDWGKTDDNNVVYVLTLKNKSTSNKTVYYRVNMRYIVEETVL